MRNKEHRITVVSDGRGDCTTIQAALDLAAQYPGDAIRIQIGKGVYSEKLVIHQEHVIFEGCGPEETILSYGDYARALMPDGTEYGTFRTASMMVDANDFTARNLTIQNTAGPGSKVGQALALYADGDRILFENCKIIGGQDTLFTAPLPPKAVIKDGFRGSKENAPRIVGRQWYKNCFIAGDVDFIFGGAKAFFEECEIFSTSGGYVTAASTPQGEKYGYVFDRCRFTGNCEAGSVYLGRPWRDYAKVVILNSVLGGHINKQGWHDWDRKSAQKNAFYAEYSNTGPGADFDSRVGWAVCLSEREAGTYSREKVLGDWIVQT